MAENEPSGGARRTSSQSTRQRRLGVLKALMSPQDLATLTEAVEAPLSLPIRPPPRGSIPMRLALHAVAAEHTKATDISA